MNAPALHNVGFRLGGQAVPIVIEEFESMILEDYDYTVCRILRKDRSIAVLQYAIALLILLLFFGFGCC